MSIARLDPWTDAATIARRLASPTSRLILVLGADSWCDTCRNFKPTIDSLAKDRAGEHEIWLWLDIEDHSEFLGDYIPPGLPMLISYAGAHVTHAVIINSANMPGIEELLARPLSVEHSNLPDIRDRLMTSDWAL